jgi:hypothetical protein
MVLGLQLSALSGLAVALVALAVGIALQVKQHGPERRERKRRERLTQRGRLGDAFITEATETTIYYTYSLQGVHYTASQDISMLRDRLPAEPERLIGVVNMKYAVNNPANSILLGEEWNGLRVPASVEN